MSTRQLEIRIDQLTEAHRALAARSEALLQVSKIMFALTPGGHDVKAQLLTAIYDATNIHMTFAGFDEAHQKDVRKTMDELAKVILAGCH